MMVTKKEILITHLNGNISLESETFYINDIKFFKFTTYYSDGYISQIVTFFNGKPTNSYRNIYENGYLSKDEFRDEIF